MTQMFALAYHGLEGARVRDERAAVRSDQGGLYFFLTVQSKE